MERAENANTVAEPAEHPDPGGLAAACINRQSSDLLECGDSVSSLKLQQNAVESRHRVS
jgi:hypothetical protein